MLNRQIETNGLKTFAQQNGLGIIAFSPVAQGVLTDRYLQGIPKDSRAAGASIFLKPEQITPQLMQAVRALDEIAAQRGQTLAQMALSWVLRDGAVTSVLIGASSPEQIKQNLAVVGASPLTADELARIDAICIAQGA